jgi:hypothetical protein
VFFDEIEAAALYLEVIESILSSDSLSSAFWEKVKNWAVSDSLISLVSLANP